MIPTYPNEESAEAIDLISDTRKKMLKEAGLDYKRFVDEIVRGLDSANAQVVKVRGAVKAKEGLDVVCTSGKVVHTQAGDSFGDGDSVVVFNAPGVGPQHARYLEILAKAGNFAPENQNHTFQNPDGTPVEFTVRFVEAKSDGT
jgi:hypothetical protein